MSEIKTRICYFGIYKPTAPRDLVYLEGLKKRGYTVVECVDNSRGLLKFFRLIKKHRELKDQYDILWVGYLSTMLVPLAWFLTQKKIVYNALDSWYDRSVLDRALYAPFSLKAMLIWCIDFLAFHMPDVVLVESEQQKLFVRKTFFVKLKKLKVVFTGVDEKVFHADVASKRANQFMAVFRGMFLPATGVETILETAKILKGENIQFTIIGWGEPIQTRVKKMIKDFGLTNVTLITWFLPTEELRLTMLGAHVMLGQFGDHERLNRTIQNKNFEAMALGMPFITRDSKSNRELLTDNVNCLFVPAEDAKALAQRILQLKKDPALSEKISMSAQELYKSRCAGILLADQVEAILVSTFSSK